MTLAYGRRTIAVVARLLQTVTVSLAALGVSVAMACSARPLDYEEDFTEAVERACADYCDVNLACRMPAAFESFEACDDDCLGLAYIYNDTDCGQAKRDMIACIGATATCELFEDTYNVHADQYTCKAEKDHYTGLNCGQSSEEP